MVTMAEDGPTPGRVTARVGSVSRGAGTEPNLPGRSVQPPLVDKSWTWNGKVYGLLKSGKKVWIKPFQAIQDCDEA